VVFGKGIAAGVKKKRVGRGEEWDIVFFSRLFFSVFFSVFSSFLFPFHSSLEEGRNLAVSQRVIGARGLHGVSLEVVLT